MKVNLIAKKQSVVLVNWVRLSLTLAVIFVLFGLGANFYLMQMEINSLHNDITYLENQLDIYLPKQQQYYDLQADIKELEEILSDEIPAYTWAEPFRELGYIIPEKAMLQEVQIRDRQIIFTGMANRAEYLQQFQNKILTSSQFRIVNLEKLLKEGEVHFRIVAELDKGGD